MKESSASSSNLPYSADYNALNIKPSANQRITQASAQKDNSYNSGGQYGQQSYQNRQVGGYKGGSNQKVYQQYRGDGNQKPYY
jgi:hypothetical protein